MLLLCGFTLYIISIFRCRITCHNAVHCVALITVLLHLAVCKETSKSVEFKASALEECKTHTNIALIE